MKEVQNKIKRYGSNVGIVDNGNLQSKMLHVILFSFGALALCYVLILGNMVFNIVARKAIEVEARTLANDVSELELSYLSASNKIDLALGHSMGFKEAKAQFVTRKFSGSVGAVKLAKNDL
jgi:hypothetical protein